MGKRGVVGAISYTGRIELGHRLTDIYQYWYLAAYWNGKYPYILMSSTCAQMLVEQTRGPMNNR